MKLKIYQTLALFVACWLGLTHTVTAQTDSVVTLVDAVITPERISIGYGAQPKSMMSSAISVVKGSELQKSFTTNLTNTLSGRLPGLTVLQSSSEAGVDGAGLQGRGVGTYVGTGQGMLVMIDGFENTMEQLVPDEIETIVLLKDASATARSRLPGDAR